MPPSRKSAVPSKAPRARRAATVPTPAAKTIVFVASRSRADRPLKVRAFTTNVRTGALVGITISKNLDAQVKTYFSHVDGSTPPLVVVTPPPPRGPVGDELLVRIADELRSKLA